jgi:segregation and condensation protein A
MPAPEVDFVGPLISIAAFQGPIDLLAYLIRDKRVDVQEISVSEIATQYVEFVRTMEILNFEEAAEFLPVAALLVLWKARSLLPRQEHEEAEIDSEAELQELLRVADERAAEYRALREVADRLHQAYEQRQQIYLRSYDETEIQSGWVILDNVHVFDMVEALRSILVRTQQRPTPVVLRPRWSVSSQMRRVVSLLRAAAAGQLTFEELFVEATDRLWVIVTFLALLELVRRGRVQVRVGEQRRILVTLPR